MRASSEVNLRFARIRSATVSGGGFPRSLERSLSRAGSSALGSSPFGSLSGEMLQGEAQLRASSGRDGSSLFSESDTLNPPSPVLSTQRSVQDFFREPGRGRVQESGRESDLVPALKDDFLGLPVSAKSSEGLGFRRSSFFAARHSMAGGGQSAHDIGHSAVPARLISHVSMAKLLQSGVPSNQSSPSGTPRRSVFSGSIPSGASTD